MCITCASLSGKSNTKSEVIKRQQQLPQKLHREIQIKTSHFEKAM
jgi:hypothetical protein